MWYTTTTTTTTTNNNNNNNNVQLIHSISLEKRQCLLCMKLLTILHFAAAVCPENIIPTDTGVGQNTNS